MLVSVISFLQIIYWINKFDPGWDFMALHSQLSEQRINVNQES